MSTLEAEELEAVFRVELPLCPYPGLRPFEKNEWPIFFGRERVADAVLAQLIGKHLLVIHGDSGCGKSSLVRAGVLPRLEQENARGGIRWRTCTAMPGETPLWNLAEALADFSGRPKDEAHVIEMRRVLNFGKDAPKALGNLLRCNLDAHLCILIDQFEELFEHAKHHGSDEARLLTAFLVGLFAEPPDGLYAILTMRSEFLGACARFRGFAETVNTSQYLLPRMEQGDLLRAIREPAPLYNGEVTRELAERLIVDAGGGQDELPLIQHGLMLLHRGRIAARSQPLGSAETWEDGRPDVGLAWRFGLEHYPKSGGLARLLSDNADAVMLKVEQRHLRDGDPPNVVENLFRALTDINAEGHAVRRRRTFAQLVAVTGADESRLRGIVDDFRADGVSFLRPHGSELIDEARDLIDISHEALIRCWQKIAEPKDGWLVREFRDGLIWRALLTQAESFERDPSHVLSPATTRERERWLKRRSAAWAERYGGGWERVQKLVDASVSAAAAAKQQEQERLVAEQEARAAQKLAKVEASKRRRTLIALLAVVILALIAALFAWKTHTALDEVLAARADTEASFLQLQDEMKRATAAQMQAERVQESAAGAVANTVSTLARETTTKGDAVQGVIHSIQSTKDSYEMAVLAQSLPQLTMELSREDAEAVLASLIEALNKSREPSTKIAIAQAMIALAPRLAAEQATAALPALFTAISKTPDLFVRQQLGEVVRALPVQLTTEQEQALRAAVLAPRVYIHIAEEEQRASALALKAQLEQIGIYSGPLIVPGIELVRHAPPRSIVRCFRINECQADGDAIVKVINRLLKTPQISLQDMSAHYEEASHEEARGIRARHYELWFAPGDIRLRPAQVE